MALVAGIVKLDDAGLYMLRKSVSGSFNSFQRAVGRSLLIVAPMLMKTLSFVGTAAMFLVGGGILVHSIPPIHHFIQHLVEAMVQYVGSIGQMIGPILLEGLTGVVSGALVLLIVTLAMKIKPSESS